MPQITTRDGVGLYYEEAGEGAPVVFIHEYAGDYRTWEPQMRHFCARIAASPIASAVIRPPTSLKTATNTARTSRATT